MIHIGMGKIPVTIPGICKGILPFLCITRVSLHDFMESIPQETIFFPVPGVGRVIVMVSQVVSFVFVLRFVKGSLISVNGVRTENLKDVWDYVDDHDVSSSLTFSTLEGQLTKRVSTSIVFITSVLLETVIVRLITYLRICCRAALYSGWGFWMISCGSK